MNIKVSIIVPVYNVSDYISQCLTSLIKQTLKEIEVIVIDDCGQDDSMNKAARFCEQDNRIRIIKNETNQGVAETRNIGISYARGKYIAFLDSDDFVDREYYEKLYDLAEKNDADIAYSNVAFYYSEQNIQHSGWFKERLFRNGKALLKTPQDRQNVIDACCCWNKIYKKDFIEKYHFNFPKGLYLEDIPFTFATSILANKLIGDPNTTLFYRQRNTNIMSQLSNNERCFDIFKILSICNSFLDSHSQELSNDSLIYKQILDAFTVEQLIGWYNKAALIYKSEFYSKARQILLPLKPAENDFIHIRVLSSYRNLFYRRILEIKLFRKIVLFTKITSKSDKVLKIFNCPIIERFKDISKAYKVIKLFNCIPLVEIVHTQIVHSISIFKLNIYRKVKYNKERNKSKGILTKNILGIFKLVKKRL